MLNKRSTYHLVIGITLLLFTQLVIPNLHHHSEKHHAQGINAGLDDACLICSLDIVAVDFIAPVLFSFSILILVHSVFVRTWNIESILFSIHKQGRAPPVFVVA